MTIKCTNCDADAAYTLADPGLSQIDYCQTCLPVPFHARAAQGSMMLRSEPEPEPKAKKEK